MFEVEEFGKYELFLKIDLVPFHARFSVCSFKYKHFKQIEILFAATNRKNLQSQKRMLSF